MTRKFITIGFIFGLVFLGFVELADAKEKKSDSGVIRWSEKPGQFAKDFSNYLNSQKIVHVLIEKIDAVIVPVNSQRSCSVHEQLDTDLHIEQIEIHCTSDEVVDTVAFALASLHITSEHCEGFYADKDTRAIHYSWRMPWSKGFVIPGDLIFQKIISSQNCFNEFVKPDYRDLKNKLEQQKRNNGSSNGGSGDQNTPAPTPPSPAQKSDTPPSGDSI